MVKQITIGIVGLVLVLVAVEGVLRLLGYQPLHYQSFSLKAEPEGCLVAHPSKGFELGKGQFQIELNKTLRYIATHQEYPSGVHRISSIKKEHQPVTILTGCSFAYGMGVSDSLSYPFLLQQNYPAQTIINAAVPGYGTIQTLQILKELKAMNQLPERVIYHYLRFHDDRNTLGAFYQEQLRFGTGNFFDKTTKKMGFPKAKLVKGELELDIVPKARFRKPLPGRESLVLVHLLDNVFAKAIDWRARPERVTETVLKEIAVLCRENHVQFAVAFMHNGEREKAVNSFCQAHDIPTADLMLNLNNPVFLNYPTDHHPNAKAHRFFAVKMQEYLQQKD